MKWMAGTLAFLTVVIVLAVKFYLPNRFHHFVHTELIKNVTDEKLFKEVSMNAHQTLINSKNRATTITSITEFNPLNYYVLIESKGREDSKKIVTAKITYSLPGYEQIKINVLFNSFHNKVFAISNPELTFATPLNKELFETDDLTFYLATHTNIFLWAESIGISSDGYGEKAPSLFFHSINASLGTKSTQGPNVVKVEGKISAREAKFLGPDFEAKFTEASQVLSIDSLKLSGVEAILKKPADPGTPADLPLPMKMMGLVPKLKSLVTLPFKVTLTSTITNEAGKMPMSYELDIRNFNLLQPDAFSMKSSFTLPYRSLREWIPEIMQKYFFDTYAETFKHPDFDDTNKKAKFKEAFKEFFAQTNETNQSKSDILLEKAVTAELLKKEGELYSTELVFENMTMSLNGKSDFKEQLVQFIPKEELAAFLVSKGFIDTTAPQKNCYTLLPGFPKTEGLMMTKEACALSCQGKQGLCLNNPTEKHLCYLNQCHWEEEMLTFQSTALAPANKALLKKHLVEVRARLKAASRPSVR